MYDLLNKKGLLISFVVGFVISLITYAFLFSSEDNADFGVVSAYILFIVAALAAIILPILNIIKKPEAMKRMGIFIGALVVIFILSWVFASSVVSPENGKDFGLTEGVSKLVGGVLVMTWILIGIAVLGILYSEIISKFIKK